MAAIPRSFITAYTVSVNRISETMRKRLADALSAVDMTQDVATIREQVIAIMQAYCGGSTDLAAQLAAEFYDGLREYELGARMGAVANSGRVPEATSESVKAFAQKLVDGKTEAFVNLCLERLDYETKVAAAQTTLNNAKRDPIKPRFARVPSGAETCDFCLMLASRGFVYHTEAAASHTHSGCDCRVTPSWKAFEVEDYDEFALYDEWQRTIKQRAKERAERKGTTEEEELQHIMDGYARSSARAKGRSVSEYYSHRPAKAKNLIPDDKAKKQALILTRGLTKETDRERVIERIIKGQEQWDKSAHSVDMDNYYAKRIRRAMVEHGISITEIDRYAQAYYANAM